MPGEKEMIAFQKAAILDLLVLIEGSSKNEYTTEEIKELLITYIKDKES